jgi:ABC-2 type transport system permease protein
MPLIALLVAKDLRRRIRSPLGILVVLAFPLIFAGMIALAFGRQGTAVPKVRLLVENLDGDAFLSGSIVSALTSSQMAEYFDVKVVRAGEGAPLMEKGEASALLRIPEKFSKDLMDGKPAALSLVRNPAEAILPEIAVGTTRILAEVLDAGSRILRGPLDRIRPYIDDGSTVISDASVSAISVAVNHAVEGARTFVAPPAITLEGAFDTKTEDDTGKNAGGTAPQIFLLVLPGIAVYSLFLVGDLGMRDVLTEAAGGTLKRLLAGPIGTGTLVLGKAAFTAVLSLLALVVMSVVGILVGGGGASPAGFLVLSLAVILAVTGAASTVYGFARNERQGATLSSIVYLFLAFVGGVFIPLDALPPAARAVAPLSPFYWGAQGYRRLIQDGAGLADILTNVAVLAGLGVVLLAIGSRALGRSFRRGASA